MAGDLLTNGLNQPPPRDLRGNKSLLDQTAHCAWTNADEAVADAYTMTPSLLSTGAKKLFDS